MIVPVASPRITVLQFNIGAGVEYAVSSKTHDARSDANLREVADERHLDFIVGFPCTRFACRGTLSKTAHQDRPAVACAGCGHVYYALSR